MPLARQAKRGEATASLAAGKARKARKVIVLRYIDLSGPTSHLAMHSSLPPLTSPGSVLSDWPCWISQREPYSTGLAEGSSAAAA